MKVESEKLKVVKLKSHSKINLGLWVKEKRLDGYHEIETIFFENENIHDEVEVQIKESKDLKIDIFFNKEELNRQIPKDQNLVFKAAYLFFEKLGVTCDCLIKINKNIPVGAGLGGGSSNAASVLKALNGLFDYQLHESELLILARQIGSDVPFFILGKTSLGKGRGEILRPLENNLVLEIKVIKPEKLSISTAWAYEQMDSREFITDHRKEIDNLIIAMKKADYELFFNNLFNDFEIAVFSVYPELINERKKLLNEGFKSVNLCGSGSALFGVKKK